MEAILGLALLSLPLSIPLLIQCAITASGLAAGSSVRLGKARFSSLDAFVDSFGDALGLEGLSLAGSSGIEGARFVGVLLSGRGAHVEFASAAWRAPLVARAGVELDPGEVARVRRLLARGGAEAALGALGVLRLELRPRTSGRPGALGKPVLELSALVPEERASAGELRALLVALDECASVCERPVLRVSESEPARRCALCHGDLGAGAGDLASASCDGCGSVLHEACWLDLGRCPALACTGRARLSEGAGPAKVSS